GRDSKQRGVGSLQPKTTIGDGPPHRNNEFLAVGVRSGSSGSSQRSRRLRGVSAVPPIASEKFDLGRNLLNETTPFGKLSPVWFMQPVRPFRRRSGFASCPGSRPRSP